MDICRYCGVEYHPMAVWIKSGNRIHVCDNEHRKLFAQITGNQEKWCAMACEEMAETDGYQKRLDLTPSR